MKNYDEASVIRSLAKKNIRVSRTGVIEVSKNNPNIGNGTLGKLDYLSHYCGYTILWTNDVKNNVEHVESPRKGEDNANEELNKPKRKKDIGLLKRVHLK